MMMFNRGNWYMDTANRPELARRCYQMAIEMNPKQPLFYAYVGWACYRKSDQGTNLAEAMDYLNQALEINVNHDEAHYFLGIIYKRQRNEEKAIHHFREVLRINPDHVQAKRESYLMESHTKKKKSLFGRMFGKK